MRTPTISSADYSPGFIPEQYNAQWMREELDRLKAAIDLLGAVHLAKVYAVPLKPRDGDIRYADGTTWDPGAGIGLYVYSGGVWCKFLGTTPTAKATLNNDGGLMVKLTNKTGAASVKGEVVHVYDATAVNNAVAKIIVDDPDPFGVFYESGIADGAEAWIVTSGMADVYFTGDTTRGHIARGYLTADGAGYVAGQALSEAVPVSPFSSDKHFYEIGHVLESRTGAGLAKCILHFN